jgi:RHS repeat-associated protein
MDRVSTRTDPLGRGESYGYDLNGNVTTVTDRKGQVTTTSYDALNRRTQVTYADGATTSYTWDAGHRLTQIVDSISGTITRTYDGLDRLTQETTPQGTVSYMYDAGGRRTSMTVAGQPAVTYTYDNADRLTQIAQGTQVVSFTYDAANRRTSLTLPNGVVTEYAYDAASRLTGLTYRTGLTVLGTLTYTYDAAGNRTEVGGTWARTALPPALTSATYDAANQQLAFGASTLTYDSNGSLTSDGTTTYTWDPRNRLMSVTGPGMTATFQYDALGRRTQKTINGTTTDFLYDGLNPVQELAGSVPAANLLTGLSIDEFFTRTDAAGPLAFLTDALQSTLGLSDAVGTIGTEYTYEPFGVTTVMGAPASNAFEYTGRENDGTGLHYYRSRYYHPGVQRFIAEDPIGLGGGDVNLYAYVGNQSTMFRDPLGLSQDNYVPDMQKHGAPHVDRYDRHGNNVGRYRHDGTPIDHIGKPSPRVPNSDAAKFAKAAAKLKKLMKAAGLLGVILDIILDPDEAGAGSDCPAGSGTCDQLRPVPPAETPRPDCFSGRKGVC